MASKSIRRRLHYGEVDRDRDEFVDKSESDGLREPLLGKYAHEHSEAYFPGDQQDEFGEIEGEQLHWTHSCLRWIVQFAQWLAHLVIGPGSLLRRLFLPPSIIQNKQDNETIQESLSSLQEERLRNLRQKLEVSYDSTCVDNQDSLKQLWLLAYPDRELPPLNSELWKEMGWQGTDPSTDFRADWEYPFAVAGVNISFM